VIARTARAIERHNLDLIPSPFSKRDQKQASSSFFSQAPRILAVDYLDMMRETIEFEVQSLSAYAVWRTDGRYRLA